MTKNEAASCMMSRAPVTYNGKERDISKSGYILTAVIARVHKGQWCYEAELYDEKSNSVYIVGLEKVSCHTRLKEEK